MGILRLFITLMCVISVFSVGCKSSIRIDQLSLPTNALEKAQDAFIKDDDLRIIEDYAAINYGQPVGDGFLMADPSDPEQILANALLDTSITFVRVPEKIDRKDHLFESISAAALRAYEAPRLLNFYFLNLQQLNHEANELHFSLSQTKEYYVHAAKLIKARLASQDIILINADSIRAGVDAETLLSLFVPHRLVVISSTMKSVLNLNLGNKKSREIFLRGLNVGEIYLLLKAHFKRTKALADEVANDALAIKLAKTIAALAPFTSVANFSQILRKIAPIIDVDNLSADAEEKMIKIIAQHAQVNYDFFASLDISTKTMSEINQNISRNIHHYTEETIKRDDMLTLLQGLKLTGTLHAEQLSDLVRRTERAISEAQHAIEQNTIDTVTEAQESLDRSIRTSADKTVAETASSLRTIKNDLSSTIRHSTTTLSDRIALGTREMTEKLSEEAELLKEAGARSLKASLDSLGSVLKKQGSDERNAVVKQLKAAVETARLALSQDQSEAIENARSVLEDAIKKAARSAGNRETVQEIGKLKESIASLIKRAQAQLSDDTAALSETLAEKIAATGEEIKQASGISAKATRGDVNQLKKESSLQQKATLTSLRAAIIEASRALDDGNEERLSLAQENLIQAFNRAINRASSNNRNAADDNTNKLLSTLEGLIKKAKAEITEHTSSEGGLLADKIAETGEELKNSTKITVNNATNRVTENVNKQTAAQQQAAVGALRAALLQAQQALDEGADDKIAAAQANLEQAFARVVNRANAGNRALAEEVNKKLAAELAALIKKAKAEITEHTSSEGGMLADKITETGEELKNSTKIMVNNATNRVTENVNKQTAAQQQAAVEALRAALLQAQQALDEGADDKIAAAQANLEQAFARVVNRANAGNRALAEEVAKKLVAELGSLIKKAQARITEHTSSESELLAGKIDQSESNIIDAGKRQSELALDKTIAVMAQQSRDQQKAITRDIRAAIVAAQQALEEGHEEKIRNAQTNLEAAIRKSEQENKEFIAKVTNATNVYVRRESEKLGALARELEASLSEKITAEAAATKDAVSADGQQTRRKNLELLRKLSRNMALKGTFAFYNEYLTVFRTLVRRAIKSEGARSIDSALNPRSFRVSKAALAATQQLTQLLAAGARIDEPDALAAIHNRAIEAYNAPLPNPIVSAEEEVQDEILKPVGQALLDQVVQNFQALENLNEAPEPIVPAENEL